MPKKNTLGKALQNQQQKKISDIQGKVKQQGQFLHQDEEVQEEYQKQEKQLISIVDQNAYNEFLQTAELANLRYEAERGKQVTQERQVIINVNDVKKKQLVNNNIYDQSRNAMMHKLRIPRRPIWNKQTTVNELRLMENQQFLSWRKDLAKFEEENYMITLTPYEKNLEVWKQLWRVTEKSDILVQVVDGRDILFYKCDDLEDYVQEQQNQVYKHKKINFLLINKSDLLSEEIRMEWNQALKNLNHMFFSAKLEQEKIDEEPEDIFMKQEQDDDNEINEKTDKQQTIVDQVEKEEKKDQEKEIEKGNLQEEKKEEKKEDENYINTHKIAPRSALLSELKKLVQQVRDEQNTEVVIGMVGYPNVGKSSVINTLCNRKLVGVASRPGKTKHFQTIELEKFLVLCDCPGLIFPNAASSRAEMVCNGVLPIDNIKDYLSPIDLLCQRIPKKVFEGLYGITIDGDLTNTALLQGYSKKRGFLTGNAQPDEAKAAKIILKDLIIGRLLYVKLPPNCQNNEIWTSNKLEELRYQVSEEKEGKKNKDDENVDEQFSNQLIYETKITNEEILQLLSQEDLYQLMEGRKVNGLKLTKEQRREIKFAYQRGEDIDLRKYLKLTLEQKSSLYKVNMKGKK